MDNLTIKRMVAYFAAKENRTEEEENFLLNLIDEMGTFAIKHLTRDDLVAKGYDISNVTDEDMERIADYMGDSFAGDDYWDALDNAAAYLDIPNKEKYFKVDCIGFSFCVVTRNAFVDNLDIVDMALDCEELEFNAIDVIHIEEITDDEYEMKHWQKDAVNID